MCPGLIILSDVDVNYDLLANHWLCTSTAGFHTSLFAAPHTLLAGQHGAAALLCPVLVFPTARLGWVAIFMLIFDVWQIVSIFLSIFFFH